MPTATRTVLAGPDSRAVRTAEGDVLPVPAGWVLVPPGDAGLTRRVKAAGPSWTVQEKVGRKLFSRGVWAPLSSVQTAGEKLAEERADPAYARKLEQARARRAAEELEYREAFRVAVVDYLRFSSSHTHLGERVAEAVTAHATPVGSGTVARTERIPIEERAESAVIAWMRHQTTAYDDMQIARIKGERRKVRRMLAERSKTLLEKYRAGALVDPSICQLERALQPRRPNPGNATNP